MQKVCLFFLAFLLSTTTLLAQNDSLDIKIGQMIMVGMSGNSVTDNATVIKDIKQGIVGGILLFEYNINPTNSEKNLKKLNANLQQAAKIPLLITIDQEGGKVNRLKKKYGFPDIPSAKAVGDKKDDAYTRSVANNIASTLFKTGINMNYGPVVDLHNAHCPVLGKHQRCYSSNPEEVVHHAAITIQEHHANKVKTVIKHFPGHGNSLTDSHLGMADVSKVWQKNELLPYKMLIDQGLVDCIMTAHIINRNLDKSGLPATLSKRIITGVLRTQMGYNGVVISDDMQMHAISSNYGFEESIKKSILAGVDIVMFSNNIKGASNYTPTNVHATIKKLVASGQIPQARINESFERIMKLKKGL